MFNVGLLTEISVQADFPLSAELIVILWITGHSSVALKMWGSVHIWTPQWEKVRGSGPPQDRRYCGGHMPVNFGHQRNIYIYFLACVASLWNVATFKSSLGAA